MTNLYIFGLLSGLLSIISNVPYIRDILKLKTKPERASWLIWSVLGGIAFFSQLAKGATDSLWMTGVQTCGVLLIFSLSIRYGVGGLTKRDMVALPVAGLGLVLWYITNEPAIALLIVILVDALGSALTCVKAYKAPDSETMSTWALSGTAGIFGALAVGSWHLILLAYPIYIMLANYAVVIAIYLGRKKFLA